MRQFVYPSWLPTKALSNGFGQWDSDQKVIERVLRRPVSDEKKQTLVT
jgi:hypothetical protein